MRFDIKLISSPSITIKINDSNIPEKIVFRMS